MRVNGPNVVGVAASSPAARRVGGSSFSLDSAEQPRGSTPSAAARSIGNIDALMALQGVEDPTERRRRAVRRGRSALDALESLKLGFLAGRLDAASVVRLKSLTSELSQSSGDERLDAVLAEIELRVEVELAKIGMPESGSR